MLAGFAAHCGDTCSAGRVRAQRDAQIFDLCEPLDLVTCEEVDVVVRNLRAKKHRLLALDVEIAVGRHCLDGVQDLMSLCCRASENGSIVRISQKDWL